MIITISGPTGSGTTAVAKLLLDELNVQGYEFNRYNIGEFFRKKHQASGQNSSFDEYWRGITIAENIQADKSILDEILQSKKNYICEARYGALACIQNDIEAYKIYLDAPLQIRVQRVRQREGNNDHRDIAYEMETRLRDEKVMGFHMYNKDFTWPTHYNSVIDTSLKNVDGIVSQILFELQLKKNNLKHIISNLQDSANI